MKKAKKIFIVSLMACTFCLLSASAVHAATGWVTSGGNKYYYTANGSMHKGWAFLNGSWYYFGTTSGAMQTGLLTDNGHLYYLYSNGKMATGNVRFPEGTYTFDASGALTTTPGWHKINGYDYYFTNSNTILTNTRTPDGYYVNGNGQWLSGVISKGIDVSRYQGTINWRAVKNAGIDFALIRVSGNSSYTLDAQFRNNMVGARNAGLKVGVYIYSYATTPAQAVAEANYVLSQIKNYTVSFPVAIDIEDSVHKSKTPAELAAIANAFCSTIEAAGYYPIVYGSKTWFSSLIQTSAINYDLWVAQYNSFCTYKKYDIWQASNTGRVNGISGNVDINYLYKDYSSIIVENGWCIKNGVHYYHKNFKPVTGMQTIDGAKYFFDVTGRMHTGWALLNNTWYFFNPDGKMATGWLEYKDDWFYLNANGTMHTGWLTIASGTYYLNPDNGDMLTGWQTINDKQYYFHESGARASGFTTLGNKTYYFGNDAALRTGWQTINGVTYYFDATGVMQTGWKNIDENRYYFNIDGSLMKEWVLLNNTWYYLDKTTGAMATGWLELGEDWFYLMPDTGAMLANCQKNIDGTVYSFDPNGYWIP